MTKSQVSASQPHLGTSNEKLDETTGPAALFVEPAENLVRLFYAGRRPRTQLYLPPLAEGVRMRL